MPFYLFGSTEFSFGREVLGGYWLFVLLFMNFASAINSFSGFVFVILLYCLLLQIGKTKVFLRAGQMAELDSHRSEVLGRSASIIQRKIRSYLAHRSFVLLRQSVLQIQSACRGIKFCSGCLWPSSPFRLYIVVLSAETTRLVFTFFLRLYFLKDNFLVKFMRGSGEKLLVWWSRETCGCILLGKLTRKCISLLCLFRQECVGWLLVLSYASGGRLEQQLLFR